MNEFPTTRWSLVAQAGGPATNANTHDVAARRDALGALLTRYLPALRAHLVRKRFSPDGVDDLLQSFVADKVIGADLLAAADRARGRFRALLVTSLNNFASNQLRHGKAERRSPKGAAVIRLDPSLECANASPCDSFDVAWAREVLAEALRRMQAECVADGREDLWEVLQVRLVRPALNDSQPMGYDEMVRRYGYTSPKHAANALVTAKRRFEQAVRSVIAEYVGDDGELEQEMAALRGALDAAPHMDGNCCADPADGRGKDT